MNSIDSRLISGSIKKNGIISRTKTKVSQPIIINHAGLVLIILVFLGCLIHSKSGKILGIGSQSQ